MRKPFFPVSLNLEGRRCVVIGEAQDREAIEKTAALLESGAEVRRLTNPQELREDDLDGAFFVISTPQDEALSARLRRLADTRGFLLCCIDQPRYGFVAMAAIAKAGPVRVAISTAGLAPRVGKVLKEALQRAMDGRFERFVAELARQRGEVQERLPQAHQQGERKRAMIEAARGFEAEVRFTYPPWVDDAER